MHASGQGSSAKRKVMHAVGACGLILAVTAGPASAVQALKSWQGDDYSRNSTTGRSVFACDGEVDGNPVKAEYARNGGTSTSTVANNRGAGTCEGVSFTGTVYKHRIIEVLDLGRPDLVGSWVYPR